MSDDQKGSLPEDETKWEPYVRAWRERLEHERSNQASAADSARKAASRAASVLVEELGCTAVYLFGSLTGRSSAPFGKHSDIDLAVEGLATDKYFAAIEALENQFPSGTRFDLVRLEDAIPSLAARVHLTGEVLAGGASLRGPRR
jgi:predicted nucleotidyltransferase